MVFDQTEPFFREFLQSYSYSSHLSCLEVIQGKEITRNLRKMPGVSILSARELLVKRVLTSCFFVLRKWFCGGMARSPSLTRPTFFGNIASTARHFPKHIFKKMFVKLETYLEKQFLFLPFFRQLLSFSPQPSLQVLLDQQRHWRQQSSGRNESHERPWPLVWLIKSVGAYLVLLVWFL